MDSYEEMQMDEENNNVNRIRRLILTTQSVSSDPTTSSRSNAGMEMSGDEAMIPCICNRPMAHVVCRKCGTEFDGRVFTHCPAHPNKIPLMDHQECVNRACRSQMLSEMSTQRK